MGGVTFYQAEKIRYKNYDDRININELDDHLPKAVADLKEAAVEQTKAIAVMISIDNFIVDPITKVHKLNLTRLISKSRLNINTL